MSVGGHWEIGLSPYAHGIRLRMGSAGQPPEVMDFCLGHESDLIARTLVAVLERLVPLEEKASLEEIDAAFPWAGTRPDPSRHLAELFAAKEERSEQG